MRELTEEEKQKNRNAIERLEEELKIHILSKKLLEFEIRSIPLKQELATILKTNEYESEMKNIEFTQNNIDTMQKQIDEGVEQIEPGTED